MSDHLEQFITQSKNGDLPKEKNQSLASEQTEPIERTGQSVPTPPISPITQSDSTKRSSPKQRKAYALLSSQHGGNIPVIPNPEGLTPRDTLYRVRVALSDKPDTLKILRGTAVIEGKPESWLVSALKPVLIILLRELSF